MGKIEAQPIRIDERSLLLHVRAQLVPQCLVQQVRRRVMALDRLPARPTNRCLQPVCAGNPACPNLAQMQMRRTGLAGIPNFKPHSGGFQRTDIANLSPGFRIKWGSIQNHRTLFAEFQGFD